MKKLGTIFLTLLVSTLLVGVFVPMINKGTGGKVEEGFDKWLGINQPEKPGTPAEEKSLTITPEMIKKDNNGNVLNEQRFTFGNYYIDLFAGSKYFKVSDDSIKILNIDSTTSSTRLTDLNNRAYIFSGTQFIDKYIRVTYDVKNCSYNGWANFSVNSNSAFSNLSCFNFPTSDTNYISNSGKHIIYTKEKNTGSYLFLDSFSITPYGKNETMEFNSIKLEISDTPFYVIDKLVTIDLNPDFFATNFSGVGYQTNILSEEYGVNMSLSYSLSSTFVPNEYPNFIDKIHFGKGSISGITSPAQYIRLSATVSEIPSTYDSSKYSQYLGENIAVGQDVVITNMNYLYHLNQLDYSHIKIELSPTPFEAAKKAVKSGVESMETNEIKVIDSVEDTGTTYWGPLH